MFKLRDKVIIAKEKEIPVDLYDSQTLRLNNGFDRAMVIPVSEYSMFNGVHMNEGKLKAHYKVILRKTKYVDNTFCILWFDGKLPKLLRVNAVMNHKESKRHLVVYCSMFSIGEKVNNKETTYAKELLMY